MFEIQHVALTVATDVDYGAVPPEKQQRRRPHPKPRKANFSKKLRQDLDQPKRHFRDFLIRDGGHGGAIDPNIRLRNMASSELRRSDPVHSKETIYKKLAEDLRSWEQPAPRGRRLAPSTAPRMGDNERG